MPAYQESASNKKQTLFVTPNWLGDCIMAMPAIELWQKNNPEKEIIIATRKNLAALWQMHAIKKQIVICNKSLYEIIKLAKKLKQQKIDEAFILPNSPRSALLPLFAKIPKRCGFAGNYRKLMLTDVVKKPSEQKLHQTLEYLALLGYTTNKISPPTLIIPEEAKKKLISLLPSSSQNQNIITIMPGAARGKSKQWQIENFIELGKKLLEHFNHNCLIVAAGVLKEFELCESLKAALGNHSINLAGKTSLSELAALLSKSKLTVANDSGGTHLSAALGTPTLAIFGITDPELTGPIGKKVMVLKASNIATRDVARTSKKAEDALNKITSEMAFAAAKKII